MVLRDIKIPDVDMDQPVLSILEGMYWKLEAYEYLGGPLWDGEKLASPKP